MNTYHYTEHEGHMLIDSGSQLWLLDTGAPASVGNAPLTLAGNTHAVADNYLGVSINDLNEAVGTYFDVLLGMDIIGSTGLFVDTASKQVGFGELPATTGHPLWVELVMGVPTLEMNISGTTQRLFFDTGAKITYLPASAVRGFRPLHEVEDFYPGFGPFKSCVYQLPADIGRRHVVIDVGVLPETLESRLLMAGTNGILGNSAWQGRSVHYSPANRTLRFDAAL